MGVSSKFREFLEWYLCHRLYPRGAKVGSAWKKELHLQQAVDVPSHGGHMGLSISEVLVSILTLELECIIYSLPSTGFHKCTHPPER